MVGMPASLYLWDIFHLLSSLPPAEWVTHLQLSSYQLTGTIPPIGVALLVAKAQGCTIPIPVDSIIIIRPMQRPLVSIIRGYRRPIQALRRRGHIKQINVALITKLIPSLPHKFNLKLVIIASIQWSKCEYALIPHPMCLGCEADEIEYCVGTDTGIVIERKETTFPCLDLFFSPKDT
jgi:hypothetical protein